MAEEWGPWIEHDGSGVPPDVPGKYLQIVSRSLRGEESVSEGYMPLTYPPAAELCWRGGGYFSLVDYAMPIIAYRIRKPRALQQLIDLVETLPEPEAVPA